MLELQNVSLKFEEKSILNNLSLTINQGEIVGVIGKSGIGKTSLLKVMSAHLTADSGKILYNGKLLIGPNEKLIPGYEDLQVVNQDFALDPYHSVEENVREKVLHLPKREQLVLIDEVLSLVELDDLKLQKAHLLSGGEQQRLALARALACEPTFIFLDEPFVHLDQALRFRIINYLIRLNEIQGDGKQILFRPNEYSLEFGENKIEAEFKRSLNTGLIVLNYFESADGTNIVLSSKNEMSKVKYFYIQKRHEYKP